MKKRNRRAPGEGGVYERARADGSIYYCAQISLGTDAKGKRKRRTVYVATQDEVKAKIIEIQYSINTKTYRDPNKMTVANLMDRWLNVGERTGLKPKTIHSYREVTRLYVLPYVGQVRLSALEPLDVEQMLVDLKARGLKSRTQQYAFALLRAALTQAVKWKLVAENVAKLVAAPRLEQDEQPAMTVTETLKFIDATANYRHGALFVLEALTGLRPGEALGLRRKDVNLDAGWIIIRQALTWLPGCDPVLLKPKTKNAVRYLDLLDEAISSLKRYLSEQQRVRESLGQKVGPDDLIFTTDAGTPLRQSNLRQTFRRILKRAGLPPHFHPYSLRHTFATMMMEADVEERVARENMGHKDSRLFHERYTHVHNHKKRESTKKVQDLLRNSRSPKPATDDD